MRKNTVTYTELIIIISIITISARLWAYKNQKNKAVTPTPGITTITPVPTPELSLNYSTFVYNKIKNDKCPSCNNNTNHTIYNELPDKRKDCVGIVCWHCGWCSFRCPGCSGNVEACMQRYLSGGPGYIIKCEKCRWVSPRRDTKVKSKINKRD